MIAEAATHPGVIYPNRHEDDEPPSRGAIEKAEVDDSKLDDLAPRPPEIDPVEAAIAARIRKFRPLTATKEQDERADWFDIGEKI